MRINYGNGKGKGPGRPGIKPQISRMIAEKATKSYPDMERLELAALLTKELVAMGEKPPSEDTLVKKISEVRNKGVLDRPWHMGLMRHPEYGITPEAIPFILKVKEWCIKTKKETPVTIRQAFWITQLCSIYDARKMDDKATRDLWQTSWVYAQYEIVCELSNTDIDTTELDSSMWYGGPATPLIEALERDIENNTRLMKKASDKLAGKDGAK